MTNIKYKYKSCSELKDIARQRLTGRYGTTFLFYLLKFTLILFAIRSVWAFIFGMIVMGLMDLGLSYFYLNAACGQPTSVNDLFYGFSRDVAKYAAIAAMSGAIKIICAAPYFVALSLTPMDVDPLSSALVIFMLALSIILYVPTTLLFSQVYYLILDFPDCNALDVFKHSFKLMKKQLGRLFYLNVSFLPMILLSSLTCGIGLFWVLPYMGMSQACFFMDIMNPAKEKLDIVSEDEAQKIDDYHSENSL